MRLEPVVSRLEKMILYETSSHYYLIGFDSQETSFRVMKMDRRILEPQSLSEILIIDAFIYSKEGIAEMLEMINEGTVRVRVRVRVLPYLLLTRP